MITQYNEKEKKIENAQNERYNYRKDYLIVIQGWKDHSYNLESKESQTFLMYACVFVILNKL